MGDITSRGRVTTKRVRPKEHHGKLVALRIGHTVIIGGATVRRVDNARNGDVQLLIEAGPEVQVGRVAT